MLGRESNVPVSVGRFRCLKRKGRRFDRAVRIKQWWRRWQWVSDGFQNVRRHFLLGIACESCEGTNDGERKEILDFL